MFEFENREAFPSGLKVLVVDADSRSLLALERLLLSCHYQVTICHRASDALSLLREKEGFFDIVMCEIHLPGGMNGIQFLEIINGLQGNSLPVVMMSRDGRQDMVMKIIMKGASDYLLKPVRIEEIRVIWQHVVRRKTNTNLYESNAIQSHPSFENSDREEKDQDQAKDVMTVSRKKPRMVWTAELHDQFVAVVNQVGLKNAVPKKILELMNVPSLSRENVASHLQKYRLHLRRKNANTQLQNKFNKFAGTNDCSGEDHHSNPDSKRVESQSWVFSEVDSEKMSATPARGNYPLDQQIMSCCYDQNQALRLEESDNFIMMQQKLLDGMNNVAAAYVSVSMEDENEGEDNQNASSFLLNDDGSFGYGYDQFCSRYEPTYF